MSTLKQQLKADVVAHMKDGNKVALATVRNVLGEIETREKSGKAPVELDDLQVTFLLQKEAAKRRETAAIYTEAGEAARAEAEIAEAEVIETYLPRPLSDAEAEGIVQDVIAELEAAGEPLTLRQMGQAMKSITPRIAGRFDGKAVSDMVRRRLAGQ
ncbi:GatB/YqeY domain-containing protein [Arthrobacter dokdonensis]|uniref:GatB/YqeY domain-containing protein n=1 Tax=Arthrobacter dokdonellae TaxID=2211210 RepID=UPI000DE57CBB|nr:GatB/YqeY domain-containing protein [Arthrobacter dokdonellae]